jgi:hypothetical protein
MVSFSDRVPGQNRDPNLLPDLNLMKMKRSSLMKNYHLLIRKARKRRAKRRKNVVVRYWLFLNLKFVWKAYILLDKDGRIITKFYYLFFIIVFQPSSDSEENRTKEKKKDKEKKSRNDSGNDKKNKEDGEWSEDELERRRRPLLEQLAEEHQWFITSIFFFFCLSVPFLIEFSLKFEIKRFNFNQLIPSIFFCIRLWLCAASDRHPAL